MQKFTSRPVFRMFLPRLCLVDGGHILRVQAASCPSAEQRHVLQSCLKTERGSQTIQKESTTFTKKSMA